MIHPLRKVVSATPVVGFRVALRFDDGQSKTVDLEPYLRGPVFVELRRDPHAFQSFILDGGTLTWPNGADIDPQVLYYDDLQSAALAATEA